MSPKVEHVLLCNLDDQTAKLICKALTAEYSVQVMGLDEAMEGIKVELLPDHVVLDADRRGYELLDRSQSPFQDTYVVMLVHLSPWAIELAGPARTGVSRFVAKFRRQFLTRLVQPVASLGEDVLSAIRPMTWQHDPQEDDPELRPLIEQAKKRAQAEYNGRRIGPAVWHAQQRILKEEYGIDWKPPAELSRWTGFVKT